jgi:Zn finger protein HypA/HybF involved in hydrogenase expression
MEEESFECDKCSNFLEYDGFIDRWWCPHCFTQFRNLNGPQEEIEPI